MCQIPTITFHCQPYVWRALQGHLRQPHSCIRVGNCPSRIAQVTGHWLRNHSQTKAQASRILNSQARHRLDSPGLTQGLFDLTFPWYLTTDFVFTFPIFSLFNQKSYFTDTPPPPVMEHFLLSFMIKWYQQPLWSYGCSVPLSSISSQHLPPSNFPPDSLRSVSSKMPLQSIIGVQQHTMLPPSQTPLKEHYSRPCQLTAVLSAPLSVNGLSFDNCLLRLVEATDRPVRHLDPVHSPPFIPQQSDSLTAFCAPLICSVFIIPGSCCHDRQSHG